MKNGRVIFLLITFLLASQLMGQDYKMESGQQFLGIHASPVMLMGDGDVSQMKAWGGFQYGRYFSSRFSLYLKGSAGWTRPDETSGKRFITYLVPATLNARFNFMESRCVPYATVGAGMLYCDLRDVTNHNEDHSIFERYGTSVHGAMQRDVMAKVGAGLEFMILDNLGINLGANYYNIIEHKIDMSGFENNHNGILEVALDLNVYFFGRRDTDNDGIYDDADLAPEEPEDFDGFEDSDGKPDLDNDNDGVPDSKDMEPNKPEDQDGFEDEDGVPDLDNDKDGIPDTEDDCPNQPETRNNYQDEDGCPDTKPKPKPKPEKIEKPTMEEKALQEKKKPIILKGVTFESGSATLTMSAKTTLDRVVQTLKNYPEMELEINGYTDITGPKSLNMKLSKERAESVKKYMVRKGIEANRLVTNGYGPANPIASNKTKTGRAKNRRIEFIRLK